MREVGFGEQLTSSQMRWRCRRGVRELDVLFTRFVDTKYGDLTKDQQSAFQRLLLEQDPEIMDWLFGKAQPPNDLAIVIELLQSQAGL